MRRYFLLFSLLCTLPLFAEEKPSALDFNADTSVVNEKIVTPGTEKDEKTEKKEEEKESRKDEELDDMITQKLKANVIAEKKIQIDATFKKIFTQVIKLSPEKRGEFIGKLMQRINTVEHRVKTDEKMDPITKELALSLLEYLRLKTKNLSETLKEEKK
jgi:hypothetical protein